MAYALDGQEVAPPWLVQNMRMVGGTYTGKAAAVGGLALAASTFAVPFLHARHLAAESEAPEH